MGSWCAMKPHFPAVSTMTDEGLHALARLLLRACSPARAYAILVRVGVLLPSRRSAGEVLSGLRRLRRCGTCLTRSLAIAARAPDVELVIGVAPRPGQQLFAHAWLELSGIPIDPEDARGSEIVRLRHPNRKRTSGRECLSPAVVIRSSTGGG